MKNIEKDIEKLLKKYDYVIIPEFGGFVLQTQMAQFKDNNIIPPTSTISFNPLLQELDGLLAIEVSRTKKINYREAVRFISNEVLYFKKRLKEEPKVPVGKLGSFSLDKENKIVFTPSINLSFLPINYGLKPRHIPNQENQKPKKSKVVINIKLPTRKKIMRYVAFFVVILGIGFFTPQTNSYHKERGTFNLIGKFDTSFNFTLNKKKLVYLPPLTMPIEKTTKFITNNIVKPTPKTKDDNKYQVIIASTKSKSEANRMRNIYIKNFNKIEIIERKGYFRVSAMGFNNKNKAYQFAQSIRRKYSQFEDAWVSEK